MAASDGNFATALAALERARSGLVARLQSEPAWLALGQLVARETAGEPLDAVSNADMRTRLETRLDAAMPEWRQVEAIDKAMAALRTAPGADALLPGEGAAKAATGLDGASSDAAGTPPRRAPGDGMPDDVDPRRDIPGRLPAAGGPPPLPSRRPVPGSRPGSLPPGRSDRPVVPLGSQAIDRNRSLVAALGALQSMAAEGKEPGEEGQARGVDKHLPADAGAVLRRIRSLTGETDDSKAPSTTASGGIEQRRLSLREALQNRAIPSSAAAVNSLPATPPPLPVTDVRGHRLEPPSVPRDAPPTVPRDARPSIARDTPQDPPPEPAPGPAGTDGASEAPTPRRDAGRPRDLNTERVAELEQEIERLMAHNATLFQRPKAPPPELPAVDDVAEDDDWDLPPMADVGPPRGVFLDEAEVEIVIEEAEGDGAETGSGWDRDADAGSEGSLVRRPGDRTGEAWAGQAPPAVDSDTYAAYRALVDEASVEIIPLDEAGHGSDAGDVDEGQADTGPTSRDPRRDG